MKPLSAPARPLEERSPAPALRRIPRPTPAQLRAERDRLYKESRFDRAIRVAEQLARVEPSREASFKLGFILREGGHNHRSLKAFRDALRFKAGPAYLVPEIHLHLAAAYGGLREYKRMGESLRRAYAARPKARSDANLHLMFGNHFLSYGKYREALAEAVRAEKASRHPHLRGRAIVNQSVAHYYQRNLGEAIRQIQRAIRIFERVDRAADLANARDILGSYRFDMGQYERARSVAMRAAREFETQGNRRRTAASLHPAGYAALELGRWDEASSHFDRAIALAGETEYREALIASHACRSIAAAHREDFDQASSDLSTARQHLKGCRYWIGSLHVYRAQGRIAALFGNWAETRRWARRAERLSLRVNDVVRAAEFRELRAKAEEELGRHRAALHARKGAASLHAVLGPGSREHKTGTLAARLADSRVPLLILGESGVGKSDLAREIHSLGPRPRKPCVLVPCEQLVFVGSEVAGHEAGAWSGATRNSEGMARKAAGGTLILDRVDELPAAAQRVLVPIVEGRIRPVGSVREEVPGYRVILVARREDRLIPGLRSRLGAVLRVPSLRERAVEIPSMVRKLLDGRRPITADALSLLARHPWDGNLPELKAGVERLVALGEGPIGVRRARQILTTPDRRRVAARKYGIRRMAEALR